MDRQTSFRKDLRRKLIFFGLVPLFIFGAVSLWPIYQNEWVRVDNEHKQLLNVVKQIVRIFHDQSYLDFENIDSDIREGHIREISRLFHRYRELDSLLVVDRNGSVVQSAVRYDPEMRVTKPDAEIVKLVKKLLQEDRKTLWTLYYSKRFRKVLATHLFLRGDRIYIENIDADPYFRGIRDLIQRSDIRSVYIYLPSGKYVYDSAGMEPIISGRSIFDQSDYLAAIKGKHPYEVTEYPTHYKEGDSFFDGLFDLDSFLSFAPMKDPPLTVVVKDSEDTIDYYLGGLLLVWVGLMFFTILIVLIVSKVMLNYIVDPVEKTIENINNLSRGLPPLKKISTERTYPIFADLVKSFEVMRRRIEDREEKLNEQLVINTEIQKKLAENEKRAALGEITGNIAHQWRQPLSTISTLATGMLMEKEMGMLDDESMKKYCRQINDNAQYLSNTIEDFRQFALDKNEEEFFDARTSIDNLMKIMGNRLRDYRIETEIRVEEGVEIYGYSNHFLHMMINLVSNSVDALLGNPEEERYLMISVTEDPQKHTIVIRVRDNGGGIDPAIINRVFEPYFTTKHKSQGTGLGLHMVQRLVAESLKGSVDVKNITLSYRGKTFRGAEFVILLPKKDR